MDGEFRISICKYSVAVVWSLSCVRLFVTPWTVVRQAPLSMGFPRQEYWSGLPYLSLGGLFNPEIEPHLLHLLHCRWILYHWATRRAHELLYIEWINKIPLFSTGNYIQYPVIKHNGKEYIYEYTHTHTHTQRPRQSTPVFLPGESHGQSSLAGCSPWGNIELYAPEAT